MHVLLVGGGGREHALAWKIAQSPLLSKLTCAPGNPGMEGLGEMISLADGDIPAFCRDNKVDLVVCGPEAPLADGLADKLAEIGVPCFGPNRDGAQLEASKSFMKGIAQAAHVPTARWGSFTSAPAAAGFLDTLSAPYVIKADGLAAGKGVVIAQTREEADATLSEFLDGRFGEASRTVVIEEFLTGTELSVFALTDGETLLHCGAGQDFKRVSAAADAPNTGGMGGFSPSPLDQPEIIDRAYKDIIAPTLAALRERGITYRGVLYAGLMITDDGPKLIEYNCRFGDPECQLLMRRLRSDILPALWGAATGRLAGVALDWKDTAVANIVMCSSGYPGDYSAAKGSAISGIETAEAKDGVIVFHAGTSSKDGTLTATGGRVLNITAEAPSLKEALDAAYAAAEEIDWPEGFIRTDIGQELR